MLSSNAHVVRLFLHVLAATVWVGGQIALAGIVPHLRKRGLNTAVKIAAQGFGRVAWPAFGVLVITGIWNLVEVDVTDTTTAYRTTLFVKVLLVGASAAGAAVHTAGRSKLALAAGGAVGLLGALGALYCGYLLTWGT